MTRKPLLYIFFIYGLLAGQCLSASEVRVNAVGGLSLVMDDETVAINPFTVGNPAGLSYLPSKNRLDLSGTYFFENESRDRFQRTYAGSLEDLQSNNVKYQGLILFPSDRWAVQLDGDYLYSEGPAGNGLNTNGNNRLRGLLRTAYNFGPLALGAEFTPIQTTSPVAGQATGGGAVVSGTDTATALSVNGGLLASFPSDPGPKQDRFEVGGTYSNQLTAPQEEVDLNVVPTGLSTPSPVTVTFTDADAQVFGLEAYFESPGSLQAAVISRFAHVSTRLQETSPNALLVPAAVDEPFDDLSQMTLSGIFKCSSPLVRGLNLRWGGFAAYSGLGSTFYNSTGGTASTATLQTFQTQVGAGVERSGDFTVGLQMALQSVTGANHDGSGNNTGDTGFLDYSFSVGGERWLSTQWAFRMGLDYQNQYNNGSVPYATFFLPAMDPGVRLLTTTITMGLGFQDQEVYGDWAFSYGVPTRDGGGPEAFATQVGVQLAVGVAFN